jgi:hypothetical protein
MSNEIRYYTEGEQATAATLNRPLADLNKQGQYISKSEFESMAEMRRNAFAGSGFIEWGTTYNISRTDYVINEGMWCHTSPTLGRGRQLHFCRRKIDDMSNLENDFPTINVDGNIIKLKQYEKIERASSNENDYSAFSVTFPEAPTLFDTETGTTATREYKVGDMFYIDNTDLDLGEEYDFSTESILDKFFIETGGKLEYLTDTNQVKYSITDTSINRAFYFARYSFIDARFIPGSKYNITVNVDIVGCDGFKIILRDTSSNTLFNLAGSGDNTMSFRTTSENSNSYLGIFSADVTDDDYILLNSISIKQAEKQLVVVTKDIEIGDNLYSNCIAVDSVSRQDLVFLETWHEDVSEKDIVYPYGNIQYRGTDRDGLSGIGEGTFDGYDTYSLFGEWQESSDLIGLGYKWSDLSNEDKLKFAGNKDNNIYKDGDNIIQVRYRVRVVKGIGNSAYNIDGTNVDYASGSPMFNSYFNRYIQVQGKNTIPDSYIDDDYSYLPANTPWTGQKRGHQIGCYAARNDNYGIERFDQTARMIPLAIFNRKNQGAYDPLYNPEGCGTFSDDKQWFETTDSHNNLIDCFNNAKNGDATVSAISGRPDGLFFDGVSGYDITDLRMDAKKIENIDTLLGTTYRKALNGDLRGNDAPFNMIKMETYSNTPMHLQHGIFGEKDSRIRIYTKEFANSRRTNIKSNDINIGNVISLYTSNGEYLSGKVIYKQNDNEYIDILVNDASDNINDCFVPYEFSTLHYKMADGIDLFAPIKKDYRYDKKAIHCEIIGKPSKYPDTWKTDGAPGKSIIYDDAQRSMKPIDRVVHTSSDTRYGDFRLSRMHNGNFEHMRVTKDAGETWYEITHGNASEAFKWEYNTTAVSFRYNTVRISFPKDWTDDIDNIVIEIIYNHTLSYIENDSIRKMISSDTTAYWHYKTHRGYYSHAVSENLLDKPVAISSYSNTPKVSININGIQNTNVFGGAHAITHDPFADMRHGSGDISDDFSVKAFPYITSKDYKARLSMLFREIVWDYDSTSEVYWDAGFISLGRDTADETTDIIIDGTEGEGGTGNDTYSILNGEDNGIKKYIDIKVAGKDLGGSISLSLQGSSDSDFEDYGDISEYIVFSVGTLRRYMVPIYDSFLNAIKFKGSIDAVYIEQVSVVKAGNSLPTEYRDGSWGDDLKFVYTNFVDIDNDDFDNEIVTGNKTIKLPYFIKD